MERDGLLLGLESLRGDEEDDKDDEVDGATVRLRLVGAGTLRQTAPVSWSSPRSS